MLYFKLNVSNTISNNPLTPQGLDRIIKGKVSLVGHEAAHKAALRKYGPDGGGDQVSLQDWC